MPAQQRGSKRARTEEEPASAGVVALHRTRFIDWQPTGVVALAASGDGSLVAAGREDGDIELYETSTSHCFQVGAARLEARASRPFIACNKCPPRRRLDAC
jgi:U3 small nucleolar RNA-associated protein 4